jgi:hypothetical protein
LERPPSPLLSRGWVIACVLAALLATDYAASLHHRAVCVDACAGAGHDLASVSSGRKFLDRRIRCDCTDGPRIRLDQSWSEYFGWMAGTVLVTGGLLAAVALARAGWRARRERPSR